MKTMRPSEALLWSIALPGFGQLLLGNYIKGIVFIALEFIINCYSHFNTIIMLSFHGQIQQAIEVCDYQWLMFYPCIYMFAAWDAFKDAGGGKKPFAFLPFAFCAYSVTVGLMLSNQPAFGILFGPVWLPILSLIPGIVIGCTIQQITLYYFKKNGTRH